MLDLVEGCDDGAGNVDTGYWRSYCLLHACSDGFVYAPLEVCDEGAANGPAYGGCDDACTRDGWGDGQLAVGHEECDEGEANGVDDGDDEVMAGCALD